MHAPNKQALAGLTLGALGVVYGDIGTSPLYTLKECFSPHLGLAPNHDNVLGILSLILWTLTLVVTLKYVIFVLRADNRGEGGIMTLSMLAKRQFDSPRRWMIMALGLIGAGLFFGDAVITPAMSVLSAVEGLEIVTPVFTPYVLPIALSVLVGLFVIQSHGTAKVGKLFGPMMLLWFSTLAVIGVSQIIHNPGVFAAINPMYAVRFMSHHAHVGYLALGSVVLCVTGAEALYADMGHFGRRPINIAWTWMVMPSLALNYLGQGALVLSNPEAVKNPFFLAAPDWAVIPMVVLATAATVIASQAVISGAFSMVRQAIQLGYLPRMEISHTSDQEIGQIYIPMVNWVLLAAVMVVIVTFQNSGALAGAYGIAVTGTMAITTLFTMFVALHSWKWPKIPVLLVGSLFLIIDLAFFSANALKLFAGGWLPLLMGAGVFLMMSTWRSGRKLLMDRLNEMAIPLDGFVENMESYPPNRVQGTAVFLTNSTHGVPHALLHNLKHNKVLHERVVLLTIRGEDVPYVDEDERVEIVQLSASFWRVMAFYGFKETPNVQQILDLCAKQGMAFELMDTSFFLSRETLIQTDRPGLAPWREKLFVWMSRNALRATDFFQIPTNRVVEMGAQVEL